MLILMEQGWPWLVIGVFICALGFHFSGLSVAEWIEYLFKLPFIYFSDNTQTEKELVKETFEEVTQANPGCIILALGILAVIVGLIKVFF